MWADLAASYEALSEPVKTLLEGRYAYHVHPDYYLGDEERSRRYDGRGGYRLQHAVRGLAGGLGHHEQVGAGPGAHHRLRCQRRLQDRPGLAVPVPARPAPPGPASDDDGTTVHVRASTVVPSWRRFAGLLRG